MRTEFVECNSRATAQRACPWASKVAKVEGGYRCWESVDEYDTWRRQVGPVTSAAGRALGSMRSPRKAAASRENGRRGGRPEGIAVYAIPTDDSTTSEGILLTDTAASRSGAIRAARRAGYRVMTVGGCIERQERSGEAPAWLVTVYR